MPLAGMAAGAAQSLEEMLTRAFIQKQQEAALALQQQNAQREADAQRIQQEQFAAGQRERAETRGLQAMRDAEDSYFRNQQLKRQQQQDATAASQRNNAQGTKTLIGDFLTRRQPGQPLQDSERATLEAMAVTDDIKLPDSLMAKPQRRVVTTIGPRGGPVSKLVSEAELEQGVPEYREPKSGGEGRWSSAGNGLLYNSVTGEFKRAPSDGATPQGSYADTTKSRLTLAIDALEPKINKSTVGTMRAKALRGEPFLSGNIDPTVDFDAALDQIKALVGFNELNAMRQASPTGGALGQVTERELAYLQSVLGSLDPNQSEPVFRQQLKKMRDEINRVVNYGLGSATSGRASGPGPAAAGGGFKILSVEP